VQRGGAYYFFSFCFFVLNLRKAYCSSIGRSTLKKRLVILPWEKREIANLFTLMFSYAHVLYEPKILYDVIHQVFIQIFFLVKLIKKVPCFVFSNVLL
jgi:hypothetical protein